MNGERGEVWFRLSTGELRKYNRIVQDPHVVIENPFQGKVFWRGEVRLCGKRRGVIAITKKGHLPLRWVTMTEKKTARSKTVPNEYILEGERLFSEVGHAEAGEHTTARSAAAT